MICGTCENGLGQISRIVTKPVVDVIFETCFDCEGAGYTCNRCGGNPARCRCDDPEPPRALRQRPGNPE